MDRTWEKPSAGTRFQGWDIARQGSENTEVKFARHETSSYFRF